MEVDSQIPASGNSEGQQQNRNFPPAHQVSDDLSRSAQSRDFITLLTENKPPELEVRKKAKNLLLVIGIIFFIISLGIAITFLFLRS